MRMMIFHQHVHFLIMLELKKHGNQLFLDFEEILKRTDCALIRNQTCPITQNLHKTNYTVKNYVNDVYLKLDLCNICVRN